MTNVFNVFTRSLCKGITANEERMEEYVNKSVGVITAINPHVGYETSCIVLQRKQSQFKQTCSEKLSLKEEY